MADPLRFVVNRHDATTLHFDLRLEADGVLVSWAVPKGPSLDPKAKRLAVQVEDHDMEHLDFEGRSENDDGRVQTKIVWDTGLYLPARSRRSSAAPAVRALRSQLPGAFALTPGHRMGVQRRARRGPPDIEYARLRGPDPRTAYGRGARSRSCGTPGLYLHRGGPRAGAGARPPAVRALRHKLKGAFALTRTRMGGNERNWILVKIDDEYADAGRDPTRDENESVLSGVTNEELESS